MSGKGGLVGDRDLRASLNLEIAADTVIQEQDVSKRQILPSIGKFV
ncbi:MAG: hypothetical protein RIE73_14805 [Coleofasciculus sp. C1-SOL-03]|jgi:hypothetical protein